MSPDNKLVLAEPSHGNTGPLLAVDTGKIYKDFDEQYRRLVHLIISHGTTPDDHFPGTHHYQVCYVPEANITPLPAAHGNLNLQLLLDLYPHL